jgi:multiple sugar transport system permease protein
MTSAAMKRSRRRQSGRLSGRREAILYVLPAVVILAVTLLYPLGHSLVMSFFNSSLYDPGASKFVGFENYKNLFFNDPAFWPSVKITGIFTGVSVALEVIGGLALALLLNVAIRGIKFARMLVLLPMMLTPIVMALIWKMLFSGDFGLINYFVSFFGVPAQQWLGSTARALPSAIVVEVWQNTSYAVLIFLSALQGVPEDVQEAAKVDGAGWWRTTWHVVLPYLRSALAFVLIIRTLFAFRAFETIFVLTGGGPADSTLILSLYLQRVAFRSFDIGRASAIGWVMFLIALIISVVYLILLRERKGKADSR